MSAPEPHGRDWAQHLLLSAAEMENLVYSWQLWAPLVSSPLRAGRHKFDDPGGPLQGCVTVHPSPEAPPKVTPNDPHLQRDALSPRLGRVHWKLATLGEWRCSVSLLCRLGRIMDFSLEGWQALGATPAEIIWGKPT